MNFFKLALVNIYLVLIAANSSAQTAITAATTVYTLSPKDTSYITLGATGSTLANKTYTYNFGSVSGTVNNDQELKSFTAGGQTYDFLTIPNQYVKLRRVNNPVVSGIRNLAFMQGSLDTSIKTNAKVNTNDNYIAGMEELFVGNKHFNSGTDNLFANQGDGNGNNNDIERVDMIFPAGISPSDNTKAGFAIFERGNTTEHDPVKVAAILGLDSNGNPNNYSSIISIVQSTYGTTDVVAPRSYIIMRRDTATEPFKMSTTTFQAIGGVFFKYSDFGIANNTVIYGYSIIPNDFPATGTPSNIINYTDTTYFPINTSSATGAGGIDLIAVTGILEAAPVINFPISGNVFDDANGLQDGIVNGTGTNAGGTLYVQLIDSSNTVISTVAVNNDGTYAFAAQVPGTYKLVLNTSAGANTAASLPTGYINTGENLGAGAGSDGKPDGIFTSVIVSEAIVSNVNFGIEQPPSTNIISAPGQVNPGGINKVTVPTLTGSDPEQGNLSGTGNLNIIVINTLPANGILYYNNIPVNAGDTIKNYNPSLLMIDPNSGAITVSFTYTEIDAALVPGNIATVTMPFTVINISGNVYDDANGLTDNMVNGTGTNAGGLNSVLIDLNTGNAIAVTAVAADGTYSFTGIDGNNYALEITTNNATAGITALNVLLPAGWIGTGENLGTAAGNDGTINSILPLGIVSTSIANADFGIEQLPVSDNKTYTIATPVMNSAIFLNGTEIAPGPLSGSDPEDGILGSGNTVIITKAPVNSLLYYDGTGVTDNTTINKL